MELLNLWHVQLLNCKAYCRIILHHDFYQYSFLLVVCVERIPLDPFSCQHLVWAYFENYCSLLAYSIAIENVSLSAKFKNHLICLLSGFFFPSLNCPCVSFAQFFSIALYDFMVSNKSLYIQAYLASVSHILQIFSAILLPFNFMVFFFIIYSF